MHAGENTLEQASRKMQIFLQSAKTEWKCVNLIYLRNIWENFIKFWENLKIFVKVLKNFKNLKKLLKNSKIL